MKAADLLAHYERIADAPDAIARLRHFTLGLAVRGKLVSQDEGDESASKLLKRISHITGRPASVDLDAEAFALPLGWIWSTIGGVTAKTGSGSTPRGGKDAYKRTGIPFLRSQNIHDDGLRLDDVAYIDAATHERMSGTAVCAGDLLLNITGGSIGRCSRVAADSVVANISQHVAIIRLAIAEMGPFAHVVVRSPYFQGFVIDEQTGAGRGGLPKNRMDRIPIPIPPLAEQHRIVAKVDELMALCDQLEAARVKRETTRDRLATASLTRLNTPDPETFPTDARFALDALPSLTTRPDQIKQLRQTILNLAVRGKLVPQDVSEDANEASDDSEQSAAGLPKSWRVVTLEALLSEGTRNGYSRRPDEAPDGVPILRISAGTVRRDGVVAEEEHKLISGIDDATRQQYGLRSGDLLACRFNGNKAFVGRLTLFTDYLRLDPIYPDKLIRVRLNAQRAIPAYVRLAGESDIVRNEIEDRCATTVGNWGISASGLKDVAFPVPPLAEQHRIVAKVGELMSLCDQLEASLTTTDTTRRRLLDALLHEAIAPARAD